MKSAVVNGQVGGVGLGGLGFDVHRSAECKPVEQSDRNKKAPLGISERQKNGIVGGLPGLGSVECIDPGIQLLAAL